MGQADAGYFAVAETFSQLAMSTENMYQNVQKETIVITKIS